MTAWSRNPRWLATAAVGAAALVGFASLTGCVGDIGDDETGHDGPDNEIQCVDGEANVERTTVRMLNRREYANTVRDLLQVPTDIVADFPPDPIVGFDNQAESLVASSTLVELHLDAAEEFSDAADLATIVPCSAAETCIDDFISTFGRRAFRRPLTDEEKQVLRVVFDDAQDRGRTVERSVRLVLQAMLMSPQFLYRAEKTLSDGGIESVDPYELASRLSYFIWASMPDDTLLDAAEQGSLSTREDVEAQARRMLGDPKAHDVTRAFHALWLKLYTLPSVTKDSSIFPTYEAMRPLFEQETARFAEHVFWDAEEGASAYLLSDTTFMNAELAEHYGVEGTSSSELEMVTTDGTDRFGFLTQGSFLSMTSNPDRTSPTRRGAFVLAQVLCEPPPPPPEDVPPLAPTMEAEGTIRERLAQHTENPACIGCHSLIDPIGFGLENYDAIARYRTEEAGVTIDASGSLNAVEDGGDFVGARQLAEQIVASQEFYECVADQWFRFAVGRPPGEADACTMEEVRTQFRASGDQLTELIVAIATSDAVLFKSTEAQ